MQKQEWIRNRCNRCLGFFFISSCLQELTHTLYLDTLCLVKGETEIALFHIPEKFVLAQV